MGTPVTQLHLPFFLDCVVDVIGRIPNSAASCGTGVIMGVVGNCFKSHPLYPHQRRKLWTTLVFFLWAVLGNIKTEVSVSQVVENKLILRALVAAVYVSNVYIRLR